MTENIDFKKYDNRFIRVLFLSVVCLVIPPVVLSTVAEVFWVFNWALAAAVFLGGSIVGWLIVFIWTMKTVQLIHIELRLKLRELYGDFDEDGMPVEVTTTDAGSTSAS